MSQVAARPNDPGRPLRVCVIPGDGIGPEVLAAAVRALRALAPDAELVEAEAGWAAFERHGDALPPATLEAARAADATLFGAVASPNHAVPGYSSPIVRLRRELDLYANIRPTQGPGVNLVIVRENTEGLYAGRERSEDGGDTAIAERVITRRASTRIARAACELAGRRAAELGRPGRVTVVHKANVLRVSDGLFREAALAVARDYPDLAVEELLVDVAAMRLAQEPARFDVVVTTNLFGDILSDVACIHGGGLGLAASANLGDGRGLFEPVHGAAPDIAG
ncbi:MAG TPA: isocitrate/isopropylmalate family dehydrogenase, partial [Chloroflexaceae bacterium]|nr:isocitrate/isopropylmalate family dehydrogenase [Chloroflexaceae bacterium]